MYLLFPILLGWIIQGLWVHGKKLWLIRHCDKPSTTESPCCSSYGYLRAELWGKYFDYRASKPLFYMASDYRTEKECDFSFHLLGGSSSSSSSRCPKSQRMYITARIIQQSLEGKEAVDNIDNHFCVGEESALVQFLLGKREEKGDVLVVWEHHGIIDILREFGYRISKWRHQWKEHYELVFWVDLEGGGWGYECYFPNKSGSGVNIGGCDKTIRGWLGEEGLLRSSVPMNNRDSFSIFWIFLGLFCGILILGGFIFVWSIFRMIHYYYQFRIMSDEYFEKIPLNYSDTPPFYSNSTDSSLIKKGNF